MWPPAERWGTCCWTWRPYPRGGRPFARTRPMTQPPYPCLWFDGQAAEADAFYCGLFPDSRILRHSGPIVRFLLRGQPFTAMDAGPDYPQSPAVSFVIECADQASIDRYWDALLEGGGKEARCGWLTDRFGVTWQVIPERLGEWLSDPESGGRATQAMLGMTKLDLAVLRDA